MIALLSALEAEIRELKKEMSIRKTYTYQNCRVYEGNWHDRDKLLVLTGMGKECARKTTELVLENFPVSVLLSTGFGGALNDKTVAGDIVVYSKLSCEGSRAGALAKDLRSDENLVSIASRSINGTKVRSLLGTGVTVSRIYDTPESKYQLGRDFLADVIDMESYWIGQIAMERKIPFLAVRSIFDTLRDDLSLLHHITAEGRIRPFKALGYFVCHPEQLKQTANYSTSYRKAGRNLATFLCKLTKEI